MRYLFLCICLICATTLSAQKQDKEPIPPSERFVYGGNVALSFGTNFTVIGASPTIGYRVTERLTAGVGGMYFYQSWRSPLGGRSSNSLYGPQAYARFMVAQDLINDGDRLFAQSDYYNTNSAYYDVLQQEPAWTRGWIPQWFVGGGYYTTLGGRMYGGLTVMWDLIQDRNAPFVNPLIQGGVSIGL